MNSDGSRKTPRRKRSRAVAAPARQRIDHRRSRRPDPAARAPSRRRRRVCPTCDEQLRARRAGTRPCATRTSSGRSARRAPAPALPSRGRRCGARGCRRSAGRRPARRGDRSRSRSARSRPPPLCRPAGTCPAGTRSRVTRPSTGVRFMCTSIGERKIVICCQSPGGLQRPSVGPAITTRAVRRRDDQSLLRPGPARSGSRKK